MAAQRARHPYSRSWYQFTDLKRMEDSTSPDLVERLPKIEPSTSGLRVRRANLYTVVHFIDE